MSTVHVGLRMGRGPRGLLDRTLVNRKGCFDNQRRSFCYMKQSVRSVMALIVDGPNPIVVNKILQYRPFSGAVNNYC